METVLDNVIDQTLTGDDPGAITGPEGKTFSQDEVNAIIKDRLAKEKDKAQKQFEALTKDLARKELDFTAKELLSSKGIPADILGALKYDDEETLKASVAIVEKLFKPTAPDYKPAAGGAPDPNQQIREAMGLLKK